MKDDGSLTPRLSGLAAYAALRMPLALLELPLFVLLPAFYIYLNGSPLGEVADPGFGPAFFAIWFDARTVAPDLRQALLGPAAPR